MNTKLLQKILSVKGQNICLTINRPLGLKKKAIAEGHSGTKHSVTKVRLGIAYDAMKDVKDKREDGTLPSEPQPLPWGKWLAYPFIIQHDNGELYLSCKKPSDPNFIPKTEFVLDGKVVSKSELAASGFCKSSELAPSVNRDTFTLKLSNVVQLGDLKLG